MRTRTIRMAVAIGIAVATVVALVGVVPTTAGADTAPAVIAPAKGAPSGITAINTPAMKGTWYPAKPGEDIAAKEAAAKASWKLAHPGQTPLTFAVPPPTAPVAGVQPHASWCWCGFFVGLLTLNHADVVGLLWTAVGAGTTAMIGAVCLLIPLWIAQAACVVAVATLGATFLWYLQQAANQWTWHDATIWCGFAWSCWVPNSMPNPLGGWMYRDQSSGLNVLLTWLAIPIGFQVNPYA